MARLVFCCSRMACSSCRASTRLMATASTSSRMPSASRKLSKVEPLWSIFFRFFRAFIAFPFLLLLPECQAAGNVKLRFWLAGASSARGECTAYGTRWKRNGERAARTRDELSSGAEAHFADVVTWRLKPPPPKEKQRLGLAQHAALLHR